MTSGSEGQRVVRQLRHDVDDVYALLTDQGSRLDGIEGRLEQIETTQHQMLSAQQQMLVLLQEIRDR